MESNCLDTWSPLLGHYVQKLAVLVSCGPAWPRWSLLLRDWRLDPESQFHSLLSVFPPPSSSLHVSWLNLLGH